MRAFSARCERKRTSSTFQRSPPADCISYDERIALMRAVRIYVDFTVQRIGDDFECLGLRCGPRISIPGGTRSRDAQPSGERDDSHRSVRVHLIRCKPHLFAGEDGHVRKGDSRL